MMEYFRSITAACALLSLSLLFFPNRAGPRRAAETVFSILFLLLLLPRGELALPDGLFSLSEAPDVAVGEEYENALAASVSEGIREDLSSRFSLRKDALSIKTDLVLSEKALTGSYLHLYLSKENFFADATAVLRYVEHAYSVPCEVYYVGD